MSVTDKRGRARFEMYTCAVRFANGRNGRSISANGDGATSSSSSISIIPSAARRAVRSSMAPSTLSGHSCSSSGSPPAPANLTCVAQLGVERLEHRAQVEAGGQRELLGHMRVAFQRADLIKMRCTVAPRPPATAASKLAASAGAAATIAAAAVKPPRAATLAASAQLVGNAAGVERHRRALAAAAAPSGRPSPAAPAARPSSR